jgi:cytochrome c oxidase assembly factor 1
VLESSSRIESLDTALATLGLGAWAAFLLHATNAGKQHNLLKSARIHTDRLSLLALVERLSSSVLRQITYQLRNSEEIKQLLGDRVHYAENWYGEYPRAVL